MKRSTVQRWLDRNPDLLERVVRRQAEIAEARNPSPAIDLTTPAARRAQEAIFARSIRERRRRSAFDGIRMDALESSMQEQLENENRALKNQAKRLEQRKQFLARRIIRARLRLERMRWRLLQRQVSQLNSVVEGEDRSEALAPQLMEVLRGLRRLAGGRSSQEAGHE